MGVLQEVLGELAGEGNGLAALDPVVEDEPGDEDRSKDGGNDTVDKGCCRALDRTGTTYIEDHTGEEVRYLTIGNCRVSVLVTVSDSL